MVPGIRERPIIFGLQGIEFHLKRAIDRCEATLQQLQEHGLLMASFTPIRIPNTSEKWIRFEDEDLNSRSVL
jgi:hypothetical protein